MILMPAFVAMATLEEDRECGVEVKDAGNAKVAAWRSAEEEFGGDSALRGSAKKAARAGESARTQVLQDWKRL